MYLYCKSDYRKYKSNNYMHVKPEMYGFVRASFSYFRTPNAPFFGSSYEILKTNIGTLGTAW